MACLSRNTLYHTVLLYTPTNILYLFDSILSDSDGDDLIASTDLSVVQDSNSQKVTSNKKMPLFENVLKRKANTPKDSPSASKSSKLDNWLTKKPAGETPKEANVASTLSNTNATKKKAADLFNFRNNKKAENSSCLLFSSKNESSPASVASSSANKLGTSRAANTLFGGMNGKMTESSKCKADQKKNNLESNLFSGMNERRPTRSCISLFSSKKSEIESSKRKREDEPGDSPKTKRSIAEKSNSEEKCIVIDSDEEMSDSVTKSVPESRVVEASRKLEVGSSKRRWENEACGSPKSKKSNAERSLRRNQEKDEDADEKFIVFDSDDESNDSITKRTSNLRVSDSSGYQSTPVEVPSMISLSQFIDVTNKPKPAAEAEKVRFEV